MVNDNSILRACSALLTVSFILAGSSAVLASTNYEPLQIRAQFFYENEDKGVEPINNNSVLKSGQHVGVVFRSQENCFVYIFWKDSAGNMGSLFPNPGLTANIPQVVAGKTYWLPHQDGDRWYILDDVPGTEVLYFVASRTRNLKLEQLARSLLTTSSGAQATQPTNQATTREVERELNMMGFAQVTAPKGVEKASYETKQELFDNLEQTIRVSGAQAMLKVQFQHVDSY